MRNIHLRMAYQLMPMQVWLSQKMQNIVPEILVSKWRYTDTKK
ncbi:hypothetical protein GPSY_4383 [Paraglaciecola psychrophila 170]|nr:hypothetical protein GPSY_4383 [Paraglaciecola psychrophila 170]